MAVCMAHEKIPGQETGDRTFLTRRRPGPSGTVQPLQELMVVFRLIYHDISAEDFEADPDTSFRPLKGNIFGIKGIHRDEDSPESFLLEKVQLFSGNPIAPAPEAVCLNKRRGNLQFMGNLNSPNQKVEIKKGLSAGKMKAVI
jgi:hypothetical protein